MSHHAFISHSSKDVELAESLLAALEQRGINCWIAPRDVPPGASYAEAILNAIQTASALVLVHTEHSTTSQHVLREVERAVKHRINIIPVRFDTSTTSPSLSYLLATIQWVSATSKPLHSSIEEVADQIGRSISGGAGSTERPKPGLIDHRPKPGCFQRRLIGFFFTCLIAVLAATVIFRPDSGGTKHPTPVDILVVKPDKDTYIVGEHMKLSVTIPRTGYLRLYSIAAHGSAVQIYPNGYASDNFVDGAKTINIPTENARYNLEVTLPTGYSTGTESVMAVLADEQFRDPELIASTRDPFPTLGQIPEEVLRSRGIIVVEKDNAAGEIATGKPSAGKPPAPRPPLTTTATYKVIKRSQ
jgi:TIR domain/Domain of unknown function (DUF4384)